MPASQAGRRRFESGRPLHIDQRVAGGPATLWCVYACAAAALLEAALDPAEEARHAGLEEGLALVGEPGAFTEGFLDHVIASAPERDAPSRLPVDLGQHHPGRRREAGG